MTSFNEIFEDPTTGAQALRDYEKQCPAIGKFKNHPPIKWAQFKRRYCQRTAVQQLEDTTPYEEAEWIEKMVTKKKWSRVKAEVQWNRMKNSGQYEVEGNETWLPKKPVRRRIVERAIEGAMAEGTEQFRNVGQDDHAALRAFTVAVLRLIVTVFSRVSSQRSQLS